MEAHAHPLHHRVVLYNQFDQHLMKLYEVALRLIRCEHRLNEVESSAIVQYRTERVHNVLWPKAAATLDMMVVQGERSRFDTAPRRWDLSATGYLGTDHR